jgi:hypothetical protein
MSVGEKEMYAHAGKTEAFISHGHATELRAELSSTLAREAEEEELKHMRDAVGAAMSCD